MRRLTQLLVRIFFRRIEAEGVGGLPVDRRSYSSPITSTGWSVDSAGAVFDRARDADATGVTDRPLG